MVLWIIGMSCSGKTALGKYIYNKLKPECNNLLFLDGDILREILGNDLGHTLEDRKQNADRINKLCNYLDSQGVNVIFALLSLFHENQKWMRKDIDNYYEVYIDADFDSLVKRDDKEIYKKAENREINNVVGVDIPFTPPPNPDITIKNNGSLKDLYNEGDKVIKSIRPFLGR